MGRQSFARLLVVVLLFACVAVSAADERILDYHSTITLSDDASMRVTESIAVHAEGRLIQRGIYRDFPTDYKDALGNRYVVDFKLLDVSRDGVPEDWRTERLNNGVRVYIGNANQRLAAGDYTYSISYRTDRQLGFFSDHDELYWNVTGSGWEFPIDRVVAEVNLPGTVRAELLAMQGYTGRPLSQGQDYTAWVRDAQAGIRSVRPLMPGEGMTLVLSFPKGLVSEPDAFDRLGYLLRDNLGLLLALAALLGSSAYLLVTWYRVGRDPEAGVIFAHYEPPAGFSPASARFIRRMGYDAGAFSAAVLNLAVKGHLKITKDGNDYGLTRIACESDLAPGEAKLLETLFSAAETLQLHSANHAIVSAARAAHHKALRRDYLNIYFRKNGLLLMPSLLGCVVAFLLTLVLAPTPLAFGVFGLIALLHALFGYLLKSPTLRGRELLDKLEGFRLYLNVAEKDDLQQRYPPEKTPELFERFLPFAVALDVAQAWAEQFTEVFARMQVTQGQAYSPRWYAGTFNALHPASFASDVSSNFTTAIASAAAPPGSSSGGSGGGFSGGGGGGGGGGGW